MKNILKALSEFQSECPIIHKSTQGYGYTFADLPTIFPIINPLLKKNGLAYSQPIVGKCVRTILCHLESGEIIESDTDIPQGVVLKGMNEFQVLGSAITYIRRYALGSMLGIITDKDTDASGEQAKKKPTITAERFEKALLAIGEGKATKEDLEKFELTAEQRARLT
jgi:hypothetical protein